jgi:hypothetical protein
MYKMMLLALASLVTIVGVTSQEVLAQCSGICGGNGGTGGNINGNGNTCATSSCGGLGVKYGDGGNGGTAYPGHTPGMNGNNGGSDEGNGGHSP